MEESSDIVNLLSSVSEVQKGFSVCPERDFNVFSLCGVDHYELWHSKIIAHFLSPQGAHGFKGEFLRAFAQCFGLGEYSDCAIVRTEVSARYGEVNFGRFDILIEDEKTRNICIVENKVFAGEGEGQLSKYKSWLDGKRVTKWITHLVYLSLNGREAQSLDDGYIQIAYYSLNSSLCQWIDRCAEIAKEKPFVRETLLQYREHVMRIATGGNAMDNQIVQKLKVGNMFAAEGVYRNYQAASLSLAKSILEGDVLEKLGKNWKCESGLSFVRRESGVLYSPLATPSAKDMAGQIYVIFAETGLVQCQVGLFHNVKDNTRIVDDAIFNSAVGKIGFRKDNGWRICESNVGEEPWPVWCPILMDNDAKYCPNGIDWNGEFFDKYYSKDSEFRDCLLEEIAIKVRRLYALQMSITRRN